MTVDDVRAFHARGDPAVGRDAGGRRRLRSRHDRASRARRVRRWHGRRGRRRARAIGDAAAAGAAEHRAAAGRAAVGAANRPRRRRAQHAGLSRAGAANMVLGGQFVSRINLNLREDKGFTYGARTAFEFRRRARAVRAAGRACRRAPPAQSIAESIAEIAAMRGSRADHRARSCALAARGADARLRAQLRDGRADRARRDAARAVRPARRLLRRVRPARSSG